MKELAGKTAVVTGAASGIGFAIAEQCARSGMRVALADIEDDALHRAADRLAPLTESVILHTTDVSDPASVDNLAASVANAFGPVHLLVNNAGVGYTGRAWKIKLSDWQWVMGVCFWGAVHGVHSFVPAMIDHGEEAHIVNTASWSGFGSAPRGAPYQAAKTAVVAMTESLYFDLHETAPQIGVSLLCPGYTNTRITESLRNHPDDAVRASASGSSRQQSTWADPDTVARLVMDAVRDRRFYALADAGVWLPIVKNRFDAVLAQSEPVAVQLPPA